MLKIMKNLVLLYPVLRRRKSQNEVSKRQLAYDYYLSDDHNNILKMRKSFMINALNINSDTLSERIKKLHDNFHNVSEFQDLR